MTPAQFLNATACMLDSVMLSPRIPGRSMAV